MTNLKRARVGDVIEHGETIPANVVLLRDVERDFWQRTDGEYVCTTDGTSWAIQPDGTGRNLYDSGRDRVPGSWFPMTVVEVDPEPPARIACSTSSAHDPHTWVYAPCTDARTVYACDGFLRLKGTATGDNQLDPLPQPVQDLSDVLRHRLHDQPTEQRCCGMVAVHKVDCYRFDEAKLRTDVGLPQQPADAEPGPVRLALPEVPAGAVALTAFDRNDKPWRFTLLGPNADSVPMLQSIVNGERTTWGLGEVLDNFREVTPEFAPPRTWPKLDPAPQIDLPAVVDVDGHGRWSRVATHHFYPEADPNGAPLTLAGLRELGQVREVLP